MPQPITYALSQARELIAAQRLVSSVELIEERIRELLTADQLAAAYQSGAIDADACLQTLAASGYGPLECHGMVTAWHQLHTAAGLPGALPPEPENLDLPAWRKVQARGARGKRARA